MCDGERVGVCVGGLLVGCLNSVVRREGWEGRKGGEMGQCLWERRWECYLGRHGSDGRMTDRHGHNTKKWYKEGKRRYLKK